MVIIVFFSKFLFCNQFLLFIFTEIGFCQSQMFNKRLYSFYHKYCIQWFKVSTLSHSYEKLLTLSLLTGVTQAYIATLRAHIVYISRIFKTHPTLINISKKTLSIYRSHCLSFVLCVIYNQNVHKQPFVSLLLHQGIISFLMTTLWLLFVPKNKIR